MEGIVARKSQLPQPIRRRSILSCVTNCTYFLVALNVISVALLFVLRFHVANSSE
jgi:hypothetical protein